MGLADIYYFNQGRREYNKEWNPNTVEEITINIVDTNDSGVDTDTVKYFKKKGMCSGFSFRVSGDDLLITSIQVGSDTSSGTEEYLNGDPLTVAQDTNYSRVLRISDNIRQIKFQCVSTSTFVRLEVF